LIIHIDTPKPFFNGRFVIATKLESIRLDEKLFPIRVDSIVVSGGGLIAILPHIIAVVHRKTILLMTYELNLGTPSSYSEMQQLEITNFIHLHHVSGFATFYNAKVLIFS